jgi:predicted HicB family RNase H-like nuclease
MSAMAAEITSSSDIEVEIRMHGREPEVVVAAARAAAVAPSDEPFDDGATARLTVRLPESLKERTEAKAAQDGLSVNAWIIRAVTGALSGADHSWGGPRRTTGFARS